MGEELTGPFLGDEVARGRHDDLLDLRRDLPQRVRDPRTDRLISAHAEHGHRQPSSVGGPRPVALPVPQQCAVVAEARVQRVPAGVRVDVPLHGGRGQDVGPCRPAGEPAAEELVLVTGEEHGRDRRLQEEPEVPQPAVRDVHGLLQAEARNREVDQDQPRHAVGMQPREAEGDHAPDVVADEPDGPRDVELLEQPAHVLGLVVLPVAVRGALGLAEPPQVGGDDLPPLRGQRRHHVPPAVGRLRPPVQQQHRVPRATDRDAQTGPVARHAALLERRHPALRHRVRYDGPPLVPATPTADGVIALLSLVELLYVEDSVRLIACRGSVRAVKSGGRPGHSTMRNNESIYRV